MHSAVLGRDGIGPEVMALALADAARATAGDPLSEDTARLAKAAALLLCTDAMGDAVAPEIAWPPH